jgi:hypothetical protein
VAGMLVDIREATDPKPCKDKCGGGGGGGSSHT